MRKLLIVILPLMAAMTILVSSLSMISAKADVITEEQECFYEPIKIRQGDNYFTIASRYNTAGIMDNVEYIREVKRINNLSSDTIHAGCYLTVICYAPENAH